jgi:hypothetical protein
MRRFVTTAIAAVIIVAIGVFAWRTFNPGPLAFARGPTVALADYQGANPTGVPAGLAKADIVKRGEYLAKAADCMVCHTVQGGDEYAGGRSARSIRPTSPPTRTPASATTAIGISSTPCSAASARMARGFIRPCPTLRILS